MHGAVRPKWKQICKIPWVAEFNSISIRRTHIECISAQNTPIVRSSSNWVCCCFIKVRIAFTSPTLIRLNTSSTLAVNQTLIAATHTMPTCSLIQSAREHRTPLPKSKIACFIMCRCVCCISTVTLFKRISVVTFVRTDNVTRDLNGKGWRVHNSTAWSSRAFNQHIWL